MTSHPSWTRSGAARILALLLAPLWMSCGGDEDALLERAGVSDSEIVIGSSLALEGFASFLGTQTLRGSLAYLQEVNAQGGVHGRSIRLIALDDGYDPARTVANTQRLINEPVFALFDYVGTPTSVRILGLLREARIPALGFFTGAQALREPFHPYAFHVRDSYYAEAEAAVAYYVDHLGLRDVAVFYQEDAFGLAVLSGVQLALERRNLETVITDTHFRGSVDVSKAMASIPASGAEVVIMVGTAEPLAHFVAESTEAGYAPHFASVSFVGAEAFGTELVDVHQVPPEVRERIMVTQVVPSPLEESLPGVREYRELSRRHFPDNSPNYVALEGFINAQVLVRALRDAGPDPTRSGFIAALEAIRDFDVGIGYPVGYGPSDREGLSGVFLSRLAPDGTFRIFTP